MPGSTGRLLLPYPVAADTADVPRDVKASMDAIEALQNWIRTADLQNAAVTAGKLDPALVSKINEPVIWLQGDPSFVPYAGQVITFQSPEMLATGGVWQFQYWPAGASTFDWYFVGGSPISVSAAGAIANIPNAWTQDPAVSTPLIKGTYMVEYGIMALNLAANQNVQATVSQGGVGAPAVPSDATNDKIAVSVGATGAIPQASIFGGARQTYGADGTLRLYERTNASAATPGCQTRWLKVTPITVGLTI